MKNIFDENYISRNEILRLICLLYFLYLKVEEERKFLMEKEIAECYLRFSKNHSMEGGIRWDAMQCDGSEIG